jgi:hypothetical protein
MGYLIEQGAPSELVKFETLIKAADMQKLATAPYTLTATQKAGFVFVPVSAFIQVNGTTPYNTFLHLWLDQPGGTQVNSTFSRFGSNVLTPGAASSFIVNIEHGVAAANRFGNRVAANRDFQIRMDVDDLSGDGDGFFTLYGYYLPQFI